MVDFFAEILDLVEYGLSLSLLLLICNHTSVLKSPAYFAKAQLSFSINRGISVNTTTITQIHYFYSQATDYTYIWVKAKKFAQN